MTGEIRSEGELSGETLEEQKYVAFLDAEGEVNRIMAEINKVFADTEDFLEAEKIVVENWAGQMDKALGSSKQALGEWREAVRQASAN